MTIIRSCSKRLVRDEGGWVLVTAVSLMAIMLIVALASLATVDTQQKRTRQQRERESGLNLAEGALYAQGFKLAQQWPGTAAIAASMPDPCTSSSTSSGCPVPAQVLQNVSNVDTKAKTTWSTVIRDNGGDLAVAFDNAKMNTTQSGTHADTGAAYTCPGPCRWDANGDRKVWVQARAIVRGRPRTVVATLKLERLRESTPQAGVTAGGINTGNNGSQVKIYAVGSNVVVRCNPSSSSCISGSGIQPAPVQGTPPNLLTKSQLARFKARAIADGRYYAGCPTTSLWDLSGPVVFIDKCVSPNLATSKFKWNTCTPTAQYPTGLPPKPAGGGTGLSPQCINTIQQPGMLIWHCGVMNISGKGTFVGVMYFVNNSDNPTDASDPCYGTPPRSGTCNGNSNNAANVLATTGGFGVWGAIAIDGQGCLYASANGLQVQYDPNVFNAVASYGTVGLVQDTWRELAPS